MRGAMVVLAVGALAACGRVDDNATGSREQPPQIRGQIYGTRLSGAAQLAPAGTDAGVSCAPKPTAWEQCTLQVQDYCAYDDPASGGDGLCRGNFTGIVCGQTGGNGAYCARSASQRWINWKCDGSPFQNLRPARCYIPADPYCLTHGPGAPGLIPGSYCHDVDQDGLDDLVFGWTNCTP